MGRKKISITRLTDERNRQITFSKRKAGLLKKAYELSILCDVEIAVIMITSNNKLYQYASSNMNSILIRYTDFKDPDENKTNADILDDITKKEKGGGGQDDSGDEESSSQSFMITPRTQENFRRIDKEFDTLMRTNQVPQKHPLPRGAPGVPAGTPLGSAPPNIPSVMPVTVPVGYSPGNVHQQIQQHLQNQLDSQKSSSVSAGLSSAPLTSASTGSLFSPQSDLSSASPMAGVRNHKSPTSMPAPLSTPTRLQTLRQHTLKLHLPGSGRNYISLPTSGSGSATVAGMEGNPGGGKKGGGGAEGEETEEGKEVAPADNSHSGTKPQLRVYIPGQKEFVPKTHDASPLPQVSFTQPAAAVGGGGGAVGVASTHTTTTTTESLTTPVLSLTTPNIFSSLPPIFSSLIGEFPFGQTPAVTGPGAASAAALGAGGGAAAGLGTTAAGTTATTGGEGGDKSSSAALVAFPVSIQPSATGGSTGGGGNLILQAQNMGQPFLLTPTYDSRQNPLFSSQGYTPPTSGLPPGLSPGIGLQNLEQLKQQYEMTQQMIQQQLLYTKMQMLQQQQSKEGPGRSEEGGPGISSLASTSTSVSAGSSKEPPGGLAGTSSTAPDDTSSSQYLNGSDVMMGLHSQGSQGQSSRAGGSRHPHSEDILPPEKRARLDTSDTVQ